MYSFIYIVNRTDGGTLIKTDMKTLKWISEYCGIISDLALHLRRILTSRSAFPTIPPVTGSESDFEKVMISGNSRKLSVRKAFKSSICGR